MDLSSVYLASDRLFLKAFTPADAGESFASATPAITRFMGWEPAPSLDAFAEVWLGWLQMMNAGTDVVLVVRLHGTREFLGMSGLHHLDAAEPEVGIWIKESEQGRGYGREAVRTAIAIAWRQLAKRAVLYPVAEENHRSRHVAERLGGRIVGTRTLEKAGDVTLPAVVYRIPASPEEGALPRA
jgi:RimJ/RimL family protein N-acetyltransferase